jgi:hypothetical protein
LLEDFGLETPDGLVQLPQTVLKKTTVNRYLRQWGYDRERLGRPLAQWLYRVMTNASTR